MIETAGIWMLAVAIASSTYRDAGVTTIQIPHTNEKQCKANLARMVNDADRRGGAILTSGCYHTGDPVIDKRATQEKSVPTKP